MEVVFFEGVMELTSFAKANGTKTIEEKVNDFLYYHPDIKIHHIKQSSASYGNSESFDNVICISIWFTEEEE